MWGGERAPGLCSFSELAASSWASGDQPAASDVGLPRLELSGRRPRIGMMWSRVTNRKSRPPSPNTPSVLFGG